MAAYHDPRQDLSPPVGSHTSRGDAVKILVSACSSNVQQQQLQHRQQHQQQHRSPHGPQPGYGAGAGASLQRSSTAPQGAQRASLLPSAAVGRAGAATPSARLRPIELSRWATEVEDQQRDELSLLMQRDATLEASKAAVRARAYAHAAAQEARTVKARLARLAKLKDEAAAQ